MKKKTIKVQFNEDMVKVLEAKAEGHKMTIEEIITQCIKEYIYSENFQMLTDYIFKKVSLKGVHQKKFFDEIARMSYEGELDVIYMDEAFMKDKIEHAKIIAQKANTTAK